MIVHFILYVRDQKSSSEFYSAVLNMAPTLDVPGMTEFRLAGDCVLGLMPEKGIKKLLGPVLPDPATARGVPRSEVYLVDENAGEYFARALAHGAVRLSNLAPRDWGHTVGYCLDADGHVLAFAKTI